MFGDFWQQAARLASPPPYPDPPTGAEQIRHITVAVGRAATMMRRYVGDIAAAGTGVRDGPWADAIARARAATALIPGRSRREADPAQVFPAGSFAARLDGYATALTYGRDLLHTHLATTPDGQRRALSDWAPVISSAPVNRALLTGLADHARAIAGQLAGLPLAGTPDPETGAAWQRLHGAAGQLRELDAAVQAAQWQGPVPAEHRQLLEAIPVNLTPAVRMPPPDATISDLCAGIISITQRANQARRELAARAAWSPELTADSMRHAAASCVVVSFNTETVYRVLASRARQLGYHTLAPGLDAAAGHAGDSRRAWLAVARAWDSMVTDTRGYLSRPAAEAGHLALWTGRLAYADPAWTPARRPSHAVRDAVDLAPGAAELTEIASALHYTADSLARAAHTDLDTVAAAGTAGRLYVTTRSLPADYDVPRPYAEAPRVRIAARSGRLRRRRRCISGDAAFSRRCRRSRKRTQPGAQHCQPGNGPPGRRTAGPPRAAPARPRRPGCRATAPGPRTGPAGTTGTGPGSSRRDDPPAAGHPGPSRTGRRGGAPGLLGR